MIQEKDRAEFIGQIIDVVEDFLDKKEPRGTEEAYIQGEWYDLLAGKLTDMMKNWDVLAEPEGPGDGEADATAECTLPPEDSDDVIILDSGNFTDAMACIRKNGFFDVDPDISLMVCKLFEKDGNLYRFDGWDHKDNCGSWQGIRMAPIRIMSSGRLEIPSAVLKRILDTLAIPAIEKIVMLWESDFSSRKAWETICQILGVADTVNELELKARVINAHCRLAEDDTAEFGQEVSGRKKIADLRRGIRVASTADRNVFRIRYADGKEEMAITDSEGWINGTPIRWVQLYNYLADQIIAGYIITSVTCVHRYGSDRISFRRNTEFRMILDKKAKSKE